MSNLKPQTSKVLKYGLGVFAPEIPAGFDMDVFDAIASKLITVKIPAGRDAGTVVLDIPPGAAKVGIVMEPGSSARFIERGGDAARDVTIDLIMGEGARADYVAVSGAAPAEFIRRQARLAAGASLEWIEACLGPAFLRSSVTTSLEGEGASVRSRALFAGAGRQQFDLWQEVRHAAPRTSSDLAVRVVLDGSAKAIVRGLIRIEKDAHGCVGRQKEETLLLSEKAEIDAMPNLEILNDDVRCGHAASAGRLDEDKMFYLMSRGFDRQEAERALVDGFIAPFLEALPDESLRAELAEKFLIGLR